MNKRINELIIESTEPTVERRGLWIDQQKFAELLIQECIAECTKHIVGSVHSHAATNNNAIGKCIDSIKKIVE